MYILNRTVEIWTIIWIFKRGWRVNEKVKLFLKKIFIRKFLYDFYIRLFSIALHGIGIANFEDPNISGEYKFLKNYLLSKEKPIILDVGANKGLYSTLIKKINPNAIIFAFEPHPITYLSLYEKGKEYNFKTFNLGIGNENKKIKLYDYKNNDGSAHASIYEDVIKTICNSETVEHKIDMVKLNDFVPRELNLEKIDLLKIDTEGNELEVLKGFSDYIENRKIQRIHFEFNKMNVISRTFFRDFIEYLKDYNLYRMLPYGLVPLKKNKPLLNEIYVYQNIVAILKTKKGLWVE